MRISATLRATGGTALLMCGACLGNTAPGYADHLYVLLVDPQHRGETASAVESISASGCASQGCTVRVDIIDLTNHTKVSDFTIPATAQAADNSPTGYANSFAVSRFGDRVYIGERMAEAVQAFSAGGVALGFVSAGAGLGGPLDMVLSSDDQTLFVLDSAGVSRFETASMTNTGRWSPDSITAQHGLGRRVALSPDGGTLVVSSDEAFEWLHFIATNTMTSVGKYSIGYTPPPTCEQRVHALLFASAQRLAAADPSCDHVYFFDVANKTYAGEVPVATQAGIHIAPASSTNTLYGTVFQDSASSVFAVSATNAVQLLGQLRGLITDIAPNVAGVSLYFSVTWTFDLPHTRRLAVLHAPTGVLVDSVYFFSASPGLAAPPRVMQMHIARKIVAPADQPGARP